MGKKEFFMKNTIKLKAIHRIAAILRIAGIIALAVVIGFSMTACGDPDPNPNPSPSPNPNPNPNPNPSPSPSPDPASGKLTITNFGSTFSTANWVFGIGSEDELTLVFASAPPGNDRLLEGVKVSGSTITLNVYYMDRSSQTFEPYTGTVTIPSGRLRIQELNIFKSDGRDGFVSEHRNSASVIITNGNATISFSTQMQEYVYEDD